MIRKISNVSFTRNLKKFRWYKRTEWRNINCQTETGNNIQKVNIILYHKTYRTICLPRHEVSSMTPCLPHCQKITEINSLNFMWHKVNQYFHYLHLLSTLKMIFAPKTTSLLCELIKNVELVILIPTSY